MEKCARLDGDNDKNEVTSLMTGVKQLSIEEKGIFQNNINMLDDYILENIFKQLGDDSELLKMEQVCQKWKNVCSNIWNRKHCLSLHNFMEFDTYESLLSRCGSKLTCLLYCLDKIHICPDCRHKTDGLKPDFFMKYYNHIIPPIIAHCTNLKKLVLFGLIKVDKSLLEQLANCTIHQNLSYLVLGDLDLSDDILQIMLNKAVNLQDLGLISITGLKGDSLMKLSLECKSLDISGCCCFEEGALVNALGRLPQLKNLTAYDAEILSLQMLIQQINLVELLVPYSKLFKDLVYDEIPLFRFPYLKKLNISENRFVTDFALSILNVICPSLEELDLSGCYSSGEGVDEEISNFGISQLVKILNLKLLLLNSIRKLDLGAVVFFANGCLKESFGQLEILLCQNSGGEVMTSSGVSSMINICPKMKVLDLSANSYLSPEFLENVLNSVNQEERNIEDLTVCSSAEKCKIHQDLL